MKGINDKRGFTAIDLFCGAGGLTTGLKKAGIKVIGALDVDELATETYSANHPEVTIWRKDITLLDPSEMMDELGLKVGELDLLAGCPPCQGFSAIRTLNKGRRVRDRRNDLIFAMVRFTKCMRPKTLMMENVPALAKNRRIRKVINELLELGYSVKIDVLDAAGFGVPQRRRRMILIASRIGPIELAEDGPATFMVRDAIGGLPPSGNSGDPLHDYPEKRSERIIKMFKHIPKDGGSRCSLPKQYRLPCHLKTDGFKDIYGRMRWDSVAPTITCGCTSPSKGRFLHPVSNRAITLREAALLQTFPDGYFFSLRRGKTGAAMLIGNALPPEFIYKQTLQIVRRLKRPVVSG